MANWNKLNKEFYSVLNDISDVDWDNWMNQRDAKKAMRRLEMELKAKMQEEKLLIDSLKAIQLYHDTLSTFNPVAYRNTVKVSATEPPAGSYALAA